MNPEVDDQMSQIYEYYPPDGYTQLVPEEEGGKNGRKRSVRKKKNEDGVMRKRKLSEAQVSMLEQSFRREHKLESERKDRLAAEVGLDPRQVAVWFQNRRARWRAKKLEEEYSNLKSQHQTALLHTSRLHTHLAKLKEQLYKADKEIERLSDGLWSNNSPMSSSIPLSMEAFVGEFGMKNEFYMTDNINCVHGLEWDNLYYV